MKDFEPAAFTVFVRIAPYPNCGFKDAFDSRVGPARSIEEAHKKIADDKAAMGNTFGGLIDSVSTKGRTYSIWKANWQKVS